MKKLTNFFMDLDFLVDLYLDVGSLNDIVGGSLKNSNKRMRINIRRAHPHLIVPVQFELFITERKEKL